MNKILLRTGGVINLLFVLLHLAMVNGIGIALAPVSADMRAIVHILNIHVAFTMLIFAYLAFFQWRDLLTTRLGHITAIAIALFWFLRGLNQVAFYGLTAPGTLMWVGLCLVFGLLHLIPAIREWKNVPGKAQRQSVSAQATL
jgi:hypothetical protein